ncbi:MAG: M61 family metallopeptidase [Fluviicola sp.]|nr:M61 family metallopeptidase [Fluviicola sp.]
MTKYSLSIEQAHQQYIQFHVQFSNLPENALIHLPRWRPGRYEFGNFAKNVRFFRVFDEQGNHLPFQKEGLSSWRLKNSENASVRIEYSYYAAELNAGSTYLSDHQLYVNPVNCFVYADAQIANSCSVQLNIPSEWEIAGSLTKKEGLLIATDFHELADSPFICSAQLQHRTYQSNETLFHLWFNGDAIIPWEKVIHDFQLFTDKQMEKFVQFPVNEYHFLFQILPNKAYHGVEHQKSTVITLGPTYDVFDGGYADLLGVSSHELYHTWNVKAIRPIEMYPYDYQQENLSKLGYLCEGVTTYMGDLMLYKSGVFNLDEYLKEMSVQLQKHFDNFGRFNYSVADSSYDTWLDGYVPGAPGRKVSIYTEGCLLAFVTDIRIRQQTENKYGLDEVMKRLYVEFALQNKGVSEADYMNLVVEYAGEEMRSVFNDYFYGIKPFDELLKAAFDVIGLEMTQVPSPKYSFSNLGFKSLPQGTNHIVNAIYPGSPADLAGLRLMDEIIAVNDFLLNGELDKWLNYCNDRQKELTVIRAGKLVKLAFPEVQRHFFLDYGIKVKEQASSDQKKAFELWSR